jgi:hypothetical protein
VCERFDWSDRLRLAAGLIDLARLRRDDTDPRALLERARFIVHGIDAQLMAALGGLRI